MSRARVNGFLFTIIITASVAAAATGGTPKRHLKMLSRHEESRVSMGCVYTIAAYGPEPLEVVRAVDEAFREVDRIDRLMSNYKPQSPLSILNREASRGPVKVEEELFDFIEECLRYSRESEGAFDITVGPLMKAWGFFRDENRVPESAEVAELRNIVGYRHLILNKRERTIQFDRPGVEIDLGGIAKGYAVDRVVRLLRNHRVPAALVSAGGSTIYGIGAPPGRDGWRVKISDPVNANRKLFSVSLKDRALSVSGNSEKSFVSGGVTYSHIMDPRTACPSQNMLGVAVLTASGTLGDALDNIFYVQSVDESRDLIKRLPPTEVYLFQPQAGERWRLIRMSNHSEENKSER